jgi:hypothetical protein
MRRITYKLCVISCLQPFSAQIDENFPAPHLDRVASHSHRRTLHHFPGAGVKLPPMPGAGHYVALERPISQRPAAVETSIVDCMELSAHVRHSNSLSFRLDLSNSRHPNKRHLHPAEAQVATSAAPPTQTLWPWFSLEFSREYSTREKSLERTSNSMSNQGGNRLSQ